MARPPGTAFLGVHPTTILARVGNFEEELTEGILDTGADITLMSMEVLSSMKNPPKVRTGQKINLLQVTG